jgi:DNA-binding NtrC family response regulator
LRNAAAVPNGWDCAPKFLNLCKVADRSENRVEGAGKGSRLARKVPLHENRINTRTEPQNMSTTPQPTKLSAASAKPISLEFPSLRERVREATRQIESEIILEVLEQNRWNRRRTAQALRISYRLLMYKMKSCNLRDENVATRAAAR